MRVPPSGRLELQHPRAVRGLDAGVQVSIVERTPLQWFDVGSWPTFAETCPKDKQGNEIAAERTSLLDTHGTLVTSNDPRHLITTVGCDNLIIIHTPEVTLICRRDCAESIKELYKRVGDRFGRDLI